MARAELTATVETLGLKFKVLTSEFHNASKANDNWAHTQYKVQIQREGVRMGDAVRVKTTLSAGTARGEPELVDVLQSLLSDARAAEQAGDFEDFCGTFGYDTDSRKAEKTYKACQAIAVKLGRLFDSDELAALHTAAEDF